VESVSSIKEAFEKMKKREFDVIASDFQMPIKDGLQFLKELRDNGNNIPFIIFIGKGREEIAIEALNLGADNYFNKIGSPETVYGELSHTIIQLVESRKAENALAESEKRFKVLFEDSPNGLVLSRLDDITVETNRVLDEVTCFKKGELVGKKIFRLCLLIKDQLHLGYRLLEKIASGKPAAPKELNIIRKDGKKIVVEIKTFPVKIQNETMMLGSIRNISERKKAENTKKEAFEKLKLLNEKLSVVGKLARHDVRNKLSVITNNVYLAKKGMRANKAGFEVLESIESAVGQAEKILEFSSNYEKLGQEELSLLNVGQHFEEAVLLLSGLDEIKFVNKCNELSVRADSLLRQLFFNLLHNSVVHGETIDRISIFYKKEKNKLQIIYEDNGVGIPNVVKNKIFEEGYGKGSGYGLFLIKKICENYGWNVKETGNQGKGSQFTITIPKTNPKGKAGYMLH